MNPLFSLVLFAVVLLCQPDVIFASSPADSVHFCAVFDYEQWLRENPPPAGKRAANLNVGPPRTVRMIYFLPSDRPFRQEVVDSMKTMIRRVQSFYLEQMQAHGHGDMTFRFETNDQEDPVVHRVDGEYNDTQYFDNTLGRVNEEIMRSYDVRANIYMVAIDVGTNLIGLGDGRRANGVGHRAGKDSGLAQITANLDFSVAAHELGHAFGLYHDFRDGAYIMSYGPGQDRLSACAAEFLAAHPYFNLSGSIERTQTPFIELISPNGYPTGSESVSIQLRVRDSDGVHQVILHNVTTHLFAGANDSQVKACRRLTGAEESVVEFEYDGVIPTRTISSLSDPVIHRFHVVAVDMEGDVVNEGFSIWQISPHQIATLSGHGSDVTSVAFSSSSAVLASGSLEQTIKLWDVETKEAIATLEGHGGISSVAFSPNGAILAAGSFAEIKLWNMETLDEIATLDGQQEDISSVAFSPDGNTLASVAWDSTLVLWDIERREKITTLKEYASAITSVAFSPDGNTLAFTEWDGMVKLLDVKSQKKVGDLKGNGFGIKSVSFSPDGTTLAWGTAGGTVILWDISAGATADLFIDASGVTSVSFSPGGAVLATGAAVGTVTLWDILTRERIETFQQASGVNSVSFSSDGAILASGARDGSVRLWETSGWTRLRPAGLEIISGNNQTGQPGTSLARPLIVEVRDQYGNPIPNAPVAFTVTFGDGKLSGKFTVEHTTTDATGRAERTLTLGPHPGINTIGISINGRELTTFTAEGVGATVTVPDENYRTWNLPDYALARLGSGAIGESDRSVSLTDDGKIVAVGSGVGVWLYEAATSRVLELFPSGSPVNTVSFSPGGTTIASGSFDGGIELWKVDTGTRLATLQVRGWHRVNSVAFSPDGAILATGSRDRAVLLWDVASRKEIASLEGHTREILSLAFSPDGALLASGSGDGTVSLWDVETRKEAAKLEGHTLDVTSVRFSPDGATLVSGSLDRRVKLWDVVTLEVTATLEAHHWVYSVGFSPDGSTLASGSTYGAIQIWDVATREEIDTLEGHKNRVRSIAFAPDGSGLISGSAENIVMLWDLKTGNATQIAKHSSIVSVGSSPDGTTLAAGTVDGAIFLWDAASREEIAILKGHSKWFEVNSVAFSPDGATLASGSNDNTIKLWNTEAQKEISTLDGHTNWVNSLSFSPDGTSLASGAWDYDVKLWDVASGGRNRHTQGTHGLGGVCRIFA